MAWLYSRFNACGCVTRAGGWAKSIFTSLIQRDVSCTPPPTPTFSFQKKKDFFFKKCAFIITEVVDLPLEYKKRLDFIQGLRSGPIPAEVINILKELPLPMQILKNLHIIGHFYEAKLKIYNRNLNFLLESALKCREKSFPIVLVFQRKHYWL